MAWIARDKDGSNPYRLFGHEPTRALMVSYGGDVRPDQWTWTVAAKGRTSLRKDGTHTYQPLSNDEPTVISEHDTPIFLEPGEGPIEVVLYLPEPDAVPPRTFEGAGI